MIRRCIVCLIQMFPRQFTAQELDCPPYDGERVSYIICAPPRVGSYLLCDLLYGSGVMGVPAEYFHPDLCIKVMAERFGLLRGDRVDLPAYTETLKKLRTTPNGVFGVKIQYWMMGPLIKNRLISKHFPGAKFIYLTRRDLVAQGVSFEIARQTDQWTSLQAKKEPAYDRSRVIDALNFSVKEQVSWETFFALNEIEPYRITYEQLIEDTGTVGRKICAYVGVTTDNTFSIDQARLKRQGDAVNEEWIRRIKEEFGY